MAAKHVLEAATNSIAPIEILFVSVDRTGTAWPCAAIVNESCFVIHADAAAGRVNQPVIERDTDASAKGGIKITVRRRMRRGVNSTARRSTNHSTINQPRKQ